MSKDIQFFGACDHIVNGEYYVSDLCPRCYGKGYYIDIFFDINGQTILSSGGIKLQQEILKIMLDEKYSNVFHKEWGSEINSNFIGTKNLSINKIKIEMLVRNSLDLLKKIQISENEQWKNMTEEEILDSIEYIEVTPLGKTGYYIEVMITNSVGQLITQSIML
jgi:hypothetical protein